MSSFLTAHRSGAWKNCACETCNIPETVEDKIKVIINSLYKSYKGFRLLPKCMTLNNLRVRFKVIASLDRGHTAGARGGQQEGQGTRPCSREGARVG